MRFATAGLIAAIALVLATPADAQRRRDQPPQNFLIERALAEPDFATATEGVRFYFGTQSHPAVAQRIMRDATTSQRASARHKSAEEACSRALLNALVSLRNHALEQGGNAVINVRSNWNHVEFSSRTEFQCVPGRMMAGVALKGDIVRVR